jgi:hypothetical protein
MTDELPIDAEGADDERGGQAPRTPLPSPLPRETSRRLPRFRRYVEVEDGVEENRVDEDSRGRHRDTDQ